MNRNSRREKYIEKFNLAPVMLRVATTHRLSKKKLVLAEELYRLFLLLKARHPRIRIAPFELADLVWHEHILLTRKYTADCEKMFGRYLHHDPNLGENKAESERIRRDTEKLVQKYFLGASNG